MNALTTVSTLALTTNATVGEAIDIRTIALAFDDATVETMCSDIEASFDRRDAFEMVNGLDIDATNSYTKAKAKMLKNSIAVARFFLAMNIAPSRVIERQVSVNKMFNAKALDKVTEIAAFVTGYGSKMQKVTSAFILCALAFDGDAIDNKVNKNFLSSDDISKMVKDQDLRDYLDTYRHEYITGGKDTQSSQVRNVLDVLGVGEIVSLERARGGFKINAQHALFDYFRAAFLK